MTQDKALLILKTGANVFLTGEPGAGKTHTINQYIAYLKKHSIDYAVTASTGIAATHIGGSTIHSWTGIGIRDTLTKYDLDKIASSEYLSKRIRKAKVLIIDEISMLSPGTLDMVDAVCREVRQSSEPFGSMQVVLVGDFFQLPPVIKPKPEDKQLALIKKGNLKFAYESNAWKRLIPIVCYITEQYRQDDESFLDLLVSIRRGDVEEEHFEYLKTRFIERTEMPDEVTKLYTHNVNVDKVNEDELNKLDEAEVKFEMKSSGQAALVTGLKKGCLSPETLVLKKGAVVMCTKNNIKENYMNGTLGTVIAFDAFSNYPIIETKKGKKITITPADWSIEDNGKVKATITQVPLRLAWAITVHKSQGMTMDSAIMDLSTVFEYGQGYVALSRVRRLDGLYLLGCNPKALSVHPEVLKEDKAFHQASAEIDQGFDKFTVDEIKKMHENFILAMGGEL
jgi:ATP-dependent exoDNAse (exonuclease V) alpha subunit